MHRALRWSRREALASVTLAAASSCLSWTRRASAQSAARVVGILSWRDPSFCAFPTEGRRDAVLVDLLRSKGVPNSNVTFLGDRQATKQSIERVR